MNLVYSDKENRVYESEEWFAVGRSGDRFIEILEEDLIPLPEGATLVAIPNTRPMGMDPGTGEFTPLDGEVNAVGALLPQGYTRLLLPAYLKRDRKELLPLFGYTAVVWKEGKFYVAAMRSDEPERWNPLRFPMGEIERKVVELTGKYAENRLVRHLSHCALEYECLTAANTFYGRWEGAVPISSSCNAGCYGCISEQKPESGFPSAQTRLTFRPTLEEVVEVMLHHLKTPESIISFGQGCEGEPSTQAPLVIEAIRAVREKTSMGYINMNTNGGLTEQIKGIVDAGLDLMRVSTISAIPEHYNAYYRPRGYTLENVEKTLRYAADHGVYTSINYLIFPGVMDREEEVEAMIRFAQRTRLKRIQLRNLNIDPDAYLSLIPPAKGELLGVKEAVRILAEEIPGIAIGSYTHPPLTT
ncbi:radical SAM protein [Thermicanus aegyptius]|uniref:radical SAM protein n=1 Tax=Thermicanus aegyptius TaxID=94009 RepID=UPI0004287313|nr:radical SAM protein [Thermicanus aegyptius]